jgi:hypothetical protein
MVAGDNNAHRVVKVSAAENAAPANYPHLAFGRNNWLQGRLKFFAAMGAELFPSTRFTFEVWW